jgi:RND family efflux transporter MFP subunit
VRAAVALLIAFGTAAALLGGCGAGDPDAGAAPAGPPVSVAHPLEREIIEWDEYTGRFEAQQEIEVRARVSGYLDSVHFTEGQMVEAGALLFVIDPRPYEAALLRAQAELKRAQAALVVAESEYARTDRLESSNAISRETTEQRLATRDGARAEVEKAQAELRAAELDLGFTRVTAPIGGRTSDIRADIGNLVSGGSPQSSLLTTIVSLDPIELAFEASESEFLKYARLIRVGAIRSPREPDYPVQARLLDEDAWVHAGKMTFVDNAIDPNTGTLRAKATFPNPDLLLQPGVFARARIPGSSEYRAILIPDDAVLSDQDNKIVMVVDAANVAAVRPVTLGPLVDGLRVVRQGLSASDRIIVNGVLRARPGQPVTPVPVDPAERPPPAPKTPAPAP